MVAIKKPRKCEAPKEFKFSKANLEKAQTIIKKYPQNKEKSAILPLLDLAQRQCGGWLPKAAMDYIADFLQLAPIRVYEVASFYTMFNLQPVGDYLIQVCRTTPCWLRGSDAITAKCKEKLAIDIGETTEDGKFTLVEVECLGACVNAPVVQINDDYFEDLTSENFATVINTLVAGKIPTTGSQTGRICSSPNAVKQKGKKKTS